MSQAVTAASQEMFAHAICRLLRESRRRQKLTQAEVSARTGGLISKAALANYETGHRSLRVDVLWVIAQALGESMGTLVSAAERGIARPSDMDGLHPLTVELKRLMESTEPRLGPVKRWIELRQSMAYGQQQSDTVMIDQIAINALAMLMGVTPIECRRMLMTVTVVPESAKHPAPAV